MLEQFFPITDPVPVFALLMLTALVAPLLAECVKLPGIIGLIVAGILIGPHGFAVLERAGGVELFGTIGLLYLMFLAGLELDLAQFIQHRHHSLIFGLLTFAIPLVFGTLMGRYLLGFGWAAAVLLSTMFSSHTLITYPLASRMGLARQRAVTTTIGGTLITDTLALLFLAVIAAAYGGDPSVFFWGRMALIMLSYVLAVVFLMPPIARWFFRRIATDGFIAYTGAMAAVFACAYMAHVAGLEPIIGAFLAGLVFNSFIPENSTLMNRIQFVGHSLFIPIFLISVGMLVNVGLFLAGGEAAVIAVAMVLAGLITKWMAAAASRRLLSYSHDEGMLIYGLSVNQAAATLAAVMVGFRIGIFSEHVVTGTVTMILVTSLAGSWLTDRYARNVALRERERPYRASDAPKRILVSLANPETADELMGLAEMLQPPHSREPLFPLTVVETGARIEERVADAEKILAGAVVRARSSDIVVSPITRTSIDVPTGMLHAMTDLRITTAVFGWDGQVAFHSQSFGRKLDAVVDRCHRMLFISRCAGALNTCRRIVLAVPPLIEHHKGFETTVHTIKNLVQQLGGSLWTVSAPSTMDRVRQIIADTPPRLSEHEVLLDRWDDLQPWMKASISPSDDLVILLNVRKGRLAWRPINSKLPRLLVSQQPDINLMVVYPPEMTEDMVEEEGVLQVAGEHLVLKPDHVALDLAGVDLTGALEILLGRVLPGQRHAIRRLVSYLSGLGEKEPAELAPGFVLLHAHVPEVLEPTALIGSNAGGWAVPHTTQAVRVLFLLLSPRDAPPERHLKALSALVGPLRRSENHGRIINARSAEELLQLWMESPPD